MLGADFLEGQPTVQIGAGCDRCHQTGYAGRVPIHEVLVPDDRLRDLIAEGAGFSDISHHVVKAGMSTLLADAREKVRNGLTTPTEVLRVLGPQ